MSAVSMRPSRGFSVAGIKVYLHLRPTERELRATSCGCARRDLVGDGVVAAAA